MSGDIIEMQDDDLIPADCLLLSTKSPQGECFVQTDSLDGEKKFKLKVSVDKLTKFTMDSIDMLQVKVAEPTIDLYDFKAIVKSNGKAHELGLDNFLPRGAFLKQGGPVMALVLYVGKDSKLV